MAPRTSLLPAGQTVVTAKTCKVPGDCPTLECWDGFCCDRHCMGKCVSCGMPGHEGICTPVSVCGRTSARHARFAPRATAPADDERCGVISCKSMNTACRTYEDIRTNRCEGLALCKTGNLANCAQYTDHYSWKDASGVYRECATGRIMNCYKDGVHFVWQDGAVIRYCITGLVCKTCKPEEP